VAFEAARIALGGPEDRRQVACFSISGASLSKLICFVFEDGIDEPVAAVKLMPEPEQGARLRGETESVEEVRRRLAAAPELAAALPLQPLYAGEVDGEYTVVEPVDPLARHAGREDREAAHRWLFGFQAATTEGEPPWDAEDLEVGADAVAYAWGRARPDTKESVLARLGELSGELAGRPVPRCAVHGDFWSGNIAHAESSMRIYDWEWARLSGRPFFDFWSYELAEVRNRAADPSYDPVEPLSEAMGRVAGVLARRGLEPEFAPATLAPAIADLTYRIRRSTGRPGGNEAGSIRVMAAAEKLLLSAS
jgi:hypothetical protein